MFSAYGQAATPERIAIYAETIGDAAPHHLAEALRDAMREVGDYPPGPGTIRRHILAIRRERPGDPMPIAPPPDAPRIGPGTAPAGALFSGLEGRVERSYQRVIERARAIRAELALPDTLDARLYSLGAAEAELHYVEPRGSCRCFPRCGEDFERRLSAARLEAAARLRADGFLAP